MVELGPLSRVKRRKKWQSPKVTVTFFGVLKEKKKRGDIHEK